MDPRDTTAPADAQAYLGTVFDAMSEGVQIIDPEWRYVYLNKAAARHGRYPREQLIGRTMWDVYPGIEKTEMFGLLQRCMKERAPQQMINPFTHPDGHTAWFDLRIDPVPMGVLVLSVDVSVQKALEEDLAITLECIADGVISTDREGRVIRMNPAAQALTGWPEEEAKGRLLDDLLRFLNQQTQAPVEHPVERVLREGLKLGLANDTVLVTRDGAHVPIASSGAPIRDANGSIRGVVMVLKNMKEEYELTAMLQQAQKMEAIGRLAGGVAHDFNNLLSVISGYSDLILADMSEGHEFREEIEEIRTAGDRAASLTRQLLAFSRKQVLKPEVLDLNAVVARMDKLLRRLIGEDIDFVTRLKPNLDPVTFDAGHIEQIIMNLVVNARDAMPKGGGLTLETANVDLDEEYARLHADARPGPHVMIAVTDSGTGMDHATVSRIFEPFFTTKEMGKGTGLGLSTVYGIVKQSGGNIWVYSEPGRGTTFKVYLPRAEDPAIPSRRAATKAVPGRGGETVLVVEDEPAVRAVIRRVLEGGGYTVLAAGGVEDALTLCREHEGPIHLLLTDVVLPGMGGRELATEILAVRPDLKVVYMSGYTDDAIVHHGVLEAGTAFIEKPITADVLLTKVREFLVGREPA